MSESPEAPRSFRDSRADCKVGDWVLASSVPEWEGRVSKQLFVPPDRSRFLRANPERGPATTPPLQPWVFRPDAHRNLDTWNEMPVWVRES